MEYQRPEPSQDDLKNAKEIATRIIVGMRSDRNAQKASVTLLVIENMRLLAECNAHRQALGYDPLQLHSAKV